MSIDDDALRTLLDSCAEIIDATKVLINKYEKEVNDMFVVTTDLTAVDQSNQNVETKQYQLQ